MVVLNKNVKDQLLSLGRFAQMLEGVSKGKDVISGKTYELKGSILLPARSPLVLELE
jgi:neopullulanase